MDIAPQVANSAFLVLKIPGNQNVLENFELTREQFSENMKNLQTKLDETLNREFFIVACEKTIIRDTFKNQTAVQENNPKAIVSNALSIAKQSNRIIQIASQEVENSEDGKYVDQIMMHNERLKHSLPDMIQTAKMLALEPSNKENYLAWASSNERLINSISKLRECVSANNETSDRSSFTSNNLNPLAFELPKLEILTLNEDNHNNKIKYKAMPVSRPTPLPDLVEENETELPELDTNQPILVIISNSFN